MRRCECDCGCTAQFGGVAMARQCPSCAAADGVAGLLLEESPSTGYVWSYELPDGVSLLHEHYLVADPSGQLVGGTGKHLFLFAGPSGGTAEIRWSLARPWEPEAVQRMVSPVRFEAHSLPSQRD